MPTTYILLGDDGRHVSLTRQGAPSTEDAREMGDMLRAKGRGGWIARMDGNYWAKVGKLDLTEVAMAAPTAITFFDAVRAFQALRRQRLGLPPSNPERAAA